MALITTDQLVYLLQQMYPDLEAGKDYLVVRWFADDTFEEQVGDAQIHKWPEGVKQPMPEALRAKWDGGVETQFHSAMKARDIRWKREALLREADALVYKAEDAGNAAAAAAARKYRQALRDVPQQPGFPDAVDWPVPPTGGA